MDVNRYVRSAAKWLSVEAVVLALWYIGPHRQHEDLANQTSMLLVMHAYLLALLVTRGADPCQRWWRKRGDGQTDSPS